MGVRIWATLPWPPMRRMVVDMVVVMLWGLGGCCNFKGCKVFFLFEIELRLEWVKL